MSDCDSTRIKFNYFSAIEEHREQSSSPFSSIKALRHLMQFCFLVRLKRSSNFSKGGILIFSFSFKSVPKSFDWLSLIYKLSVLITSKLSLSESISAGN